MERVEFVPEAAAADEAHDEVRLAVGPASETVDGHDPGVLDRADDLGFEFEPAAMLGDGGEFGLDLFQGHFAIKLGIVGHVEVTGAAVAEQAANPEPAATLG